MAYNNWHSSLVVSSNEEVFQMRLILKYPDSITGILLFGVAIIIRIWPALHLGMIGWNTEETCERFTDNWINISYLAKSLKANSAENDAQKFSSSELTAAQRQQRQEEE